MRNTVLRLSQYTVLCIVRLQLWMPTLQGKRWLRVSTLTALLVLLSLFLFLMMNDNSLFKEIANRTSRAQLYYTNASNLVTSYHSFRSKYHRQNDWFLRLWLHQDLNPNLRAYLATFTYRPECHPNLSARKNFT